MDRFKNILFVADPATDNAGALRQALALCRNNQASLKVVSVIPEPKRSGRPKLSDAVASERLEWIEELLAGIETHGVDLSSQVLSGRPFIALISQVLAQHHDLLVKPIQKPPGVIEHIFDSTDKNLLRKCPCPVWLIKAAERTGDLQFLVALDYEPDNAENRPLNQQLLDMAVTLTLSEFAELHVVHAWQLEHEGIMRSPRLGMTNEEVDELVRQEQRRRHDGLTAQIDACCKAHGANAKEFLMPHLHLVKGRAQDVVPEYARELGAELLIMGTLARTGIPGMLIGNTSEAILEQLDCSILAVKPQGFVSPVTAT